ncbi:MAG: CBS domain-containing protein [Thermoplasmata archaeon]|nr:CBS domain-containing protein [Thermoplasmata archaeon]
MSDEEVDKESLAPGKITLSDFNITDEYDTVLPEDPMKAAAEKILELKKGIVFVMEEKGPTGIIGGEEILKAISEGKGPDTPCSEVASANLLEVHYSISMTELIPLLIRERPRAVVVRGEEGEFKGFFSPRDYVEALKKAGLIP